MFKMYNFLYDWGYKDKQVWFKWDTGKTAMVTTEQCDMKMTLKPKNTY